MPPPLNSKKTSIFLTGPPPTLKFSPNDIWLPGIYSRRILTFSLPPTTSPLKITKLFSLALQALVLGTPELGALSTILPHAPHDPSIPWRAFTPGPGIELVVQDLSQTFKSFAELERKGFPIEEFKDEILMPIQGRIMPEPAAVSKFQLNFIEGGLVFCACIYHHFSDGNGMNFILRAVAEEFVRAGEILDDDDDDDDEGEGEGEGEELPGRVLETSREVLERAVLSDEKEEEGEKEEVQMELEDHPAYNLVEGLFTPGVEHPHEESEEGQHSASPSKSFTPKYYHLTHTSALALKAHANTTRQSTDPEISTHDAISALLWRNLIITRHRTGELPNLSAISTFTLPHNARKYLPSLPQKWVGNCLYFIIAQATISEILHPDSLPVLASRIRTALNRITAGHVKGISRLRFQHPYDLNWWPLGQVSKGEIVGMTSFYHSDLLDFYWGEEMGGGGGRARHFCCTDLGGVAEGELQRVGFVGPRVEGGKGCWVFVGLLEGEVEGFEGEEVWRRFFSS